MARIRTIKPEFFTSLTVADLPVEARLTFIGLWTHVDDEGRCVHDARLIKAALWPLDNRLAEDVESDLRVLVESSLIAHYKAGRRCFLAVNGWSEHQKIDRPTPSKHPAPDDGTTVPLTCMFEDSPNARRGLDESSTRARLWKGTGNREGNREQGTGKAPASPSADVADQVFNLQVTRANGDDARIVRNNTNDRAAGLELIRERLPHCDEAWAEKTAQRFDVEAAGLIRDYPAFYAAAIRRHVDKHGLDSLLPTPTPKRPTLCEHGVPMSADCEDCRAPAKPAEAATPSEVF